LKAVHKYRDIGIKLTPQRTAILDYLDGNKQHPSAEEIYKELVKTFPTMSFATVYTTLAALKEKGAVSELTIDPDRKRYDPETGSCNHMICISCKRIVDIAGAYRHDLSDSIKQGFTVIESRVEVYGFCPECKQINSRM
jgi:Fur family peroxide stress response transcriptional regulator